MDNLPQQLRQLRKARGLSLKQMSELTGLSIGYLSQVERSISNLTIPSVRKIADSLRVPVAWLFEDQGSGDPAEQGVIVRREHRRRMTYREGTIDFLLSPDLNRKMELILSVFDPGAEVAEPYTHRGEEAGLIVLGTMDLFLGDSQFRLKEGDSFYFSSESPHRYRNAGKDRLEVLWVITPPTY